MRKLTFLVLLALPVLLTAQTQRRAFTIEDLYRVETVHSLLLSPDGSKLIYTHSRSQLKTQASQYTPHLLHTRTGQDDSLKLDKAVAVGWSADGKSLYYLCAVDQRMQLFRYTFKTSQSEQITHYALGVTAPVVSSDGRYVAFSADVYPEWGGEQPEKTIERARHKAEGPVQAHMADHLLFRHWTSYQDGLATHLILLDTRTQQYRDLTLGTQTLPFNLGGEVQYQFSPDEQEICYVMNTSKHPEANTNSDLFILPTAGGSPQCLTAGNTAWDGTPSYSPDGRYIAYRRQSVPGYESDCFQLVLYDRKTRQIIPLTTNFDNWVSDFQWASNSKSLLFTAPVRGYQPLYRIDIEKKSITEILSRRAIGEFQASPKGELYYTYTRTGKPNALYAMAHGKEQQLTFYNRTLENEVDIRPSEAHWIEGAAGDSVEFFVVKPHGFDPHRKYPVVINVHGGPQMQWMDSFRGDWQVYPGAGYVVVYPNPHGSTGYGQAFCRAISGDWGGKVYEDIMRVTDAVEQLPYVDKERIGAMGWSYGGYMMNWLQGHTRRFKCLASMMGVYDMRSMWGSTEELWFPEFEMEGRPWNSTLYEKWSPSAYAKDFATPTLIITGEKDYRVPYTQSLQYFSALQAQDIPSRLIVLKNDGHWPGHLTSMPIYYNAHLDWFHRYLGGEPAPWDMEKIIYNEIEYK